MFSYYPKTRRKYPILDQKIIDNKHRNVIIGNSSTKNILSDKKIVKSI